MMKIWLLTLTAIMPDGRHLTTHDTYATQSYCRAAGMITSDKLRNAGNPTAYDCSHIQLESLDLKTLVAPEDFELMVLQEQARQKATPSAVPDAPAASPTAANR